MNAVFIICNVITGRATTLAPSPELAEREFDRLKKHRPEWVIAEFPKALGIGLQNFTTFPKSMIYNGVALYANRKAGK